MANDARATARGELPTEVLIEIVRPALELEAIADRAERKRTLRLISRSWSEAVDYVARRDVSVSSEAAVLRLERQIKAEASLVRRLAMAFDETDGLVKGATLVATIGIVELTRDWVREIDLMFLRPGSVAAADEFWRFAPSLRKSGSCLRRFSCDLRGALSKMSFLQDLLVSPALCYFGVPELEVERSDGVCVVRHFDWRVVQRRDGPHHPRGWRQSIAGLQDVLPVPIGRLHMLDVMEGFFHGGMRSAPALLSIGADIVGVPGASRSMWRQSRLDRRHVRRVPAPDRASFSTAPLRRAVRP